MFIALRQIISDEEGDVSTYPVLVNSENILSLYPAPDNNNYTYVTLSADSTILVNDTFESIIKKLEVKPISKGSSWIPCSEFIPDVDDDYLVSIGKDAFMSYSVDVDSFKHGKWKNYGKKVLAWQPFPDPYEK